MLQEVGVTHCIIGHSERREMFGDTDETVNKKAKRLIDAGITPIFVLVKQKLSMMLVNLKK